MPRLSALIGALFVVTTCVFAGNAAADPAVDRHAKSAKQCTDELRKNQAALAATGESASAFFHRCWWESEAGQPTPLLTVAEKNKSTANEAEVAKAQNAAKAAKADAEKAKADADAAVAKAQEETARAKAEIAKARDDEARAKEDAAKQIAHARAAAAAEAAARSQAQREAQAAKDEEAAVAKANAKQREAAEAAAAKARAAVEVAAAAKALDTAKAQAAAKVQAAAKALNAAKVQAEDAKKAASLDTHAGETPAQDASAPSKSSDANAPQQGSPAASDRTSQEGAAPSVVAGIEPQQARSLVPHAVLFGRGHLRRRSVEIGRASSRRLRAASFESVAASVHAPRTPAESPVVSMVKVHIQGVSQPIMWPVFPEFVPAFREFVNHPIVPGFTSTP